MPKSIRHICACLALTLITVSAFGDATPGPRLSYVKANGIRIRIAEQGEGPLVLLLHGFPETWYSWRHQLGALADGGYRAVAPDLRGFGGSDAPAEIEAYDLVDLCGDVRGLIERLGEEKAVLVGHDWGGLVAWSCTHLDPEPITALVLLGVPMEPTPDRPPTELFRAAYGDNFYYVLYFQEPGVAEAELDADPRGLFQRILASPNTPREPPRITDPKASAGGILGRYGVPKEFPSWLTQEDFDHYVAEFTRTGFRGGLNYYRNFDRSWEMLYQPEMEPIRVPVLFVGGEKDPVLGARDADAIEVGMRLVANDVRGVHLLPEVGHWIQQERPAEVNALLLDFLGSLDQGGALD